MGYDAMGSWTGEDDAPIPEAPEELSDQDKLKLELQKLQQDQTGIVPKTGFPSPEELDAAHKLAVDAVRKTTTPPTPQVVQPGDIPDLPQKDYTPSPDANIRMLSTEKVPGKTFSPEVERAAEQAAKLYGIDPNLLKGFVSVESGGDPNANRNNPNRQYKGLMQIGGTEWKDNGQGGDIYDPLANMMGGARLMQKNRQDFVRNFHREPTPAELYLIHQQGLGFYTNGTMTNIAGNLPPQARTPENMTHAGFEKWWTDRINRAIAERGTAPTMRVAQDSNLPSGFLYPGPFADVGGGPLTKGGIPDTPEAQAEIAQLMQGTPLAQVPGAGPAALEAAAGAKKDPRYAQPRVLPKVGTTPQTQQVQGQLPVSVNQTDTLPIPGITTPGQQALTDATNPSLMSTIMNFQAMNKPPVVTPPVKDQINQPAQGPSFIDKLLNVLKTVNSLSPISQIASGDNTTQKLVEAAANAPLSIANNPQAMATLQQNVTGVGQGLAAGTAHWLPDAVAGAAGPALAAAGQLTGNQTLKQAGGQVMADAAAWRQATQKFVGIDPNNPTAMQSGAEGATQVISPNPVKAVINTAGYILGEKVLNPLADQLGQKFPISNLNPFPSAQAATAFGAPPLVINTPGGPVVMNDAELSSMVYGGALAMGFGMSVGGISRGVRYVKEAQTLPFTDIGLPGLKNVFDPRREVPGAPGTQAASIASDTLKGGTIDRTAAMLDIADRQHRYESATGTGVDPVAAEAVRQKWRVQTGSGAQNLIGNVLANGVLNTDDFRFNVQVPIRKLAEFGKANPLFSEYIKVRMLEDEFAHNASRLGLKDVSPETSKQYPQSRVDHNGRKWDWSESHAERQRMEADNPDLVNVFNWYKENLKQTRAFVSDHQSNPIENARNLNDEAMKRPSFPIFSEKANTTKILDRVMAGEDPLRVTEDGMRNALGKQMKYDAEVNYRNMATETAFTPRDANWATGPAGAEARAEGAVLRRRDANGVQYWTADPLVVSLMNSDHVPLAGWDVNFARLKSVFQATTTGAFAPWFAPTGAIRAMEQGWTTAPKDVKTAGGRTVLPSGPYSSIKAVGQQLGPKMANFFAEAIKNTTMGQMIDGKFHGLLARTFEKAYNESIYKRMQDAGAYNPETFQQAQEIHSTVTKQRLANTNAQMNPVHQFIENGMDAWMKWAWRPLKAVAYTPLNETLRAVQEAPNFAWAAKTLKGSDQTNRPTIKGRAMSDAEVAARMRDYTGDPATRGFIFSTDLHGNKEQLRFLDPKLSRSVGPEPSNPIGRFIRNLDQATAASRAGAYKSIGVAAHSGRAITPWSGVLFQSPAATIKAMRDNPVRANLAFVASSVLPEMVSYLWNAYHSNQQVFDSNGQPVIDPDTGQQKVSPDYVNYMMYGRSDPMNNTYFATPGENPENGVEFKQFQETIFTRAMTRAFMHQYTGRSVYNMGEDVQNALMGFLKGAVIPPQPSPLTGLLGAYGLVMPEGWLGTVYNRRNNENVVLGGGDSHLELMFRGLAPAIADISNQAIMAGKTSPTWGDVPKAVAKQVGNRIGKRTAIIGDVMGHDVSGMNQLSNELWENKHVIDDLMYYYKVWDVGEGDVSTKGGSKEGKSYTAGYLKDLPPNNEKDVIWNPGMPQPKPKNPAYNVAMNEVAKTFGTDNPDDGGIGFKSMWTNYKVYGNLVSRMRTVYEGNASAWAAEQAKDTNLVKWLRDRKVNPYNYNEVRNFYQARRNDAAQKILYTIKATEQRLNNDPRVRAALPPGQVFRLKDLNPNTPGLQQDPDASQ